MANPRIDELKKRLEREPGSRLFAQLAEELRKEGDLTEAIRVARAGLAAHPNYPSARMTLGRALFDTGELAAARAELENVLRGAPDNILAARMLAECLEGLGDPGAALLQYRAALRLAPGDRQIESQIRALEQRLVTGGGAGPARPVAPSAPPAAAPAPRATVPPPMLPATTRMSAPPVPAIPSVPPLPPGRPTSPGSGQAASAAVAQPDADFEDVFESSPSWQRPASLPAAPADDAILLLEDEAPTLPGSPFGQGLTAAPAPPPTPPSGARLSGAPPLPAAHAVPPPSAAPPSAVPPVPPAPPYAGPSHAAPAHVAPPHAAPAHRAPLAAPPVPAPPVRVPPAMTHPMGAPPPVVAQPAAAPPSRRPPDPVPVPAPPAPAFAVSPRPPHEDSGATYPLKRPEARGFDSIPSGLGSAPVTMAFDEPPRVDLPPEDEDPTAGLGADTLAGQPAFGEEPPPDPFAPSPIPEASEAAGGEADPQNAKTDPGRTPFADAPAGEPAVPPVAMSHETSSTAAYPVFAPAAATFEAPASTMPPFRQGERKPIFGDMTAEAEASLKGSLPPRVPLTPFGAAEDARGPAGAEAAEGASAADAALSSSTLAELYFEQGFFDKAVEVYEQLLEKEPRNERARARLIEIKARAHGAPLGTAAPAADPHAARRQSLERTIARLERMLAAVRRQ